MLQSGIVPFSFATAIDRLKPAKNSPISVVGKLSISLRDLYNDTIALRYPDTVENDLKSTDRRKILNHRGNLCKINFTIPKINRPKFHKIRRFQYSNSDWQIRKHILKRNLSFILKERYLKT
jgi:hypothetical protein